MIKTTRLNRADRDSGFTLIELMVVVTIVGVLAAVAIPRYISYVRTSQTAEVGQIGGSIVSAMQAYADAQSLTAAAAVALFNTQVVTPAGVAPPAGKDLKTILPQINLPANATFTYTVAAVEAADAPGETAYCITATGTTNAGVSGGLVLYSSAPAVSSANGWAGRVFNRNYINGTTNLTGASAGGYCTSAGATQATRT